LLAVVENIDTSSIQTLIAAWTHVIQALVGAIGGLAFALAFLWKIIAIEPRSVTEAKRWIGRIVFGTLGVELATQLVSLITSAAGAH
jgi:hypothetical protein